MNSILKFCVVGASGATVDTAVLWMFTEQPFLSVPLLAAKALAIECGVLNNFVWNDRWTFRHRIGTAQRWLVRFARFHAVALLGMALNLTVFFVLTRSVGLPLVAANAGAIGVAAAVNFLGSGRWAWEERCRKGEDTAQRTDDGIETPSRRGSWGSEARLVRSGSGASRPPMPNGSHTLLRSRK